MRPTFKTLCIFLAIVALSLLILVFKSDWAILCVIMPGLFLVIMIMDGFNCRPADDFSIRHRLPQTLYIGATDYLELEVIVPDHWPVQKIEAIIDIDDKFKQNDKIDIYIDAMSRNLVKIDLTPEMRGMGMVEAIWLRWQGALGLVEWVQFVDINQEIPIIPNIKTVAKDALEFSSRDALFGIKPQAQLGDGSEFDALRDYVPGFDSRAIDWKSSARHHKLICKEFQTERNHQIMMVYDTGHLMIEPVKGMPKIDHAINAGLLLSYLSLKFGDKVGVMGFDVGVNQYLPPISNVQSFNKIQQVSAKLNYSHEEANYTIAMTDLLSKLNRRSLIILITDFVDTISAELMMDNVMRLARKHLVIFVSLKDNNLNQYSNAEIKKLDDMTGAVLAQDFISEREVVLEKMARYGIQCIDTTIENLKVDLLNKYIHIKLREMI